jgi:hypothetical protein
LFSDASFGFDFKEKRATLYDEGTAKINVSTWEQCGRVVAALLSLKKHPENEDDHSPTISTWKNKSLRISSFLISQKDYLKAGKESHETKMKIGRSFMASSLCKSYVSKWRWRL